MRARSGDGLPSCLGDSESVAPGGGVWSIGRDDWGLFLPRFPGVCSRRVELSWIRRSCGAIIGIDSSKPMEQVPWALRSFL